MSGGESPASFTNRFFHFSGSSRFRLAFDEAEKNGKMMGTQVLKHLAVVRKSKRGGSRRGGNKRGVIARGEMEKGMSVRVIEGKTVQKDHPMEYFT